MIMLACAKNISEGGVALVFLANVVPSLLLKLSAPYWFANVSYGWRIYTATACMVTAFGIVAYATTTTTAAAAPGEPTDIDNSSSQNNRAIMIWQLVGVAFISLQCGLGEATLLALAGKHDHVASTSRGTPPEQGNGGSQQNPTTTPRTPTTVGHNLTAFSSGTGLAGPAGFLFKVMLNEWLGWTLSETMMSAMLLAVIYAGGYARYLAEPPGCVDGTVNDDRDNNNNNNEIAEEEVIIVKYYTDDPRPPPRHDENAAVCDDPARMSSDDSEYECFSLTTEASPVPPTLSLADLSAGQRFCLVLSLWPYMIPLFTVYAAEYACQSGAWTAIGFPVASMTARNRFYERSNWLYQVGVLVSRSSGTMVQVSVVLLWIMPVLQVVNLVFFTYIGLHQDDGLLLYQPQLLYILALWTGLLGGAVYVHGYQRIVREWGPRAEFALATVSVAEGMGVLCANVLGLVLQACLYQAHGLPGAVMQCPIKGKS